jgi:thioredoxin reductase (NADPH)
MNNIEINKNTLGYAWSIDMLNHQFKDGLLTKEDVQALKKEFAKLYNITDEQGYVITDENMRTQVKGIYAAGDVRKKELFQITTAVSDGAIAAISVNRDINS